MDESISVREACRRRLTLDGTDAQALEHALTITERERDEARSKCKTLRSSLRNVMRKAYRQSEFMRNGAGEVEPGERLAMVARTAKAMLREADGKDNS